MEAEIVEFSKRDEDIKLIDVDYYDYVLTHTCPISIFEKYKIDLCTLGNIVDDKDPQFKISNNKLEQVKNFIDFGHWLFRSLSHR